MRSISPKHRSPIDANESGAFGLVFAKGSALSNKFMRQYCITNHNPNLVALAPVPISSNLSGPPAGSRFAIVDIPFVNGTEYDQWKYVCRETAARLAASDPEHWKIEGENMSVETTIATINAETMKQAPAILATAIAVENAVGSTVPGTAKAEIVSNAVFAGAQAMSASPNVTVAGIASLTALFVSILNATGIFKHAAPKQ